MTERCVFCSLLSGELEASVAFQDELVMAVMTIRPMHVGHVLLFPRAHVEDFVLLDRAGLGHLFHVAARLKNAICDAVVCEGFQVLINEGEATHQKQDCRHLHVHLIPRSINDGAEAEGRAAEAPRAELDATAREIARRMNTDDS